MNLKSVLRNASTRFSEPAVSAREYFREIEQELVLSRTIGYHCYSPRHAMFPSLLGPASECDGTCYEISEDYRLSEVYYPHDRQWNLGLSDAMWYERYLSVKDEMDIAWKQCRADLERLAFDEYSQHAYEQTVEPNPELADIEGVNTAWQQSEQRKQARAKRRVDTKRHQKRRKRLAHDVKAPEMRKLDVSSVNGEPRIVVKIRPSWQAYNTSIRKAEPYERTARDQKRHSMMRWLDSAAAHDLYEYDEVS